MFIKFAHSYVLMYGGDVFCVCYLHVVTQVI